MTTTWLALVIGNTRLHWGLFAQDNLLAWHTPHLSSVTAHRLATSQFAIETWRSIPGWTPATVTGSLGHEPATDSVSTHSPFMSPSSLWLASAVPTQANVWLQCGKTHQFPVFRVERSHIPLAGIYPTLGIDRAINLLGAGDRFGWPVLVVDGGTALTFTAGAETDVSSERFAVGNSSTAAEPTVLGGAILPGLALQWWALAEGTAALAGAVGVSHASVPDPKLDDDTSDENASDEDASGHAAAEDSSEKALSEPERSDRVMPAWLQTTALPTRWATDTSGAIASGLLYGAIATISDYLTDWWQAYPTGKVVFTGGDGPRLQMLLADFLKQAHPKQDTLKQTHLRPRAPETIALLENSAQNSVQLDAHLMFWGMRAYRNRLT